MDYISRGETEVIYFICDKCDIKLKVCYGTYVPTIFCLKCNNKMFSYKKKADRQDEKETD